MRTTNQKGSVIAVVAIFAFALAFVTLAISQNFKAWSQHSAYLASMNRAYLLAETGLNAALGELRKNPDLAEFNTSPTTVEGGEFQNYVFIRHSPVDPVFYIVTSATATVGGKEFTSRLHSYARVSNTGEYFLAINDNATISHPVNIANGRVFAVNLTLLTDGNMATKTQLKEASYKTACFQKMAGGGATSPWDGTANDIEIDGSSDGEPLHLPQGLIFPQLLDDDIAYYRNLAGPHVLAKDFAGEIYPPGYSEFSGTNASGDTYVGHTSDNKQHVYFFDGDVTVKGRVHGQVLIVATGNITIKDNLITADGDSLPGDGQSYGSKAHQIVLITKKNVIIDNTMAVAPPTVRTVSIGAMIIAPLGQLQCKRYADTSLHNYLKLDFKGSILIQTFGTNPSIPEVFASQRDYAYDDSFQSTPPPYLPSISIVYFSAEETVGAIQ